MLHAVREQGDASNKMLHAVREQGDASNKMLHAVREQGDASNKMLHAVREQGDASNKMLHGVQEQLVQISEKVSSSQVSIQLIRPKKVLDRQVKICADCKTKQNFCWRTTSPDTFVTLF